jgi:hypothetical protein
MPLLLAAGIGAGTSLIGGLIGSVTAGNAGKTLSAAGTTAATNINNTAVGANAGIGSALGNASGELSSATGAAQAGMSPYQQAGQQGVQSLAQGLSANGQFTQALNNNFSFNPSNLQNTPGYQFQLQQGLQATQNQMTASGLGNSGAAMKGASNYATGLAGTYFQNAYNNALSTYQTNRQNTLYQIGALQNMAGQGQQAQEYIGSTGMQGAQALAGTQMQAATQQGNWSMGGMQSAMQDYMQGQGGAAAGQMGAGNAMQSGLVGAGNSFMNMAMLNQMYGANSYNQMGGSTPGYYGASGALLNPYAGGSAAGQSLAASIPASPTPTPVPPPPVQPYP